MPFGSSGYLIVMGDPHVEQKPRSAKGDDLKYVGPTFGNLTAVCGNTIQTVTAALLAR
jgi:hypothetical protein